jgi:hypothetical protein
MHDDAHDDRADYAQHQPRHDAGIEGTAPSGGRGRRFGRCRDRAHQAPVYEPAALALPPLAVTQAAKPERETTLTGDHMYV